MLFIGQRSFKYIRMITYMLIFSGVEPELFPCLRKFGISFYEFNPRKCVLIVSHEENITVNLC